MLIVKDLKELNVGDGGDEIWKIVVVLFVLKFKSLYLEPGGNIEWKDKFINCKIERTVNPPKYLFSKKPNNNKKKVWFRMKLPQRLTL